MKYTKAQRDKVKELYAIDRRLDSVYKKGRFTLKQISEITKVSITMVYYIANGMR